MAEPEFSETQFVFGYLRELFDQYKGTRWSPTASPYFSLPSTVKEKATSADFLINLYSHSEYYQFKRSHRLKSRRGPIEIRANVPSDYKTYYRFNIYNRRTLDKHGNAQSGQYEVLVQQARNKKNRVYYCAPCFHEEAEFFDHFNNEKIMEHSILINCEQLTKPQYLSPNFDINDGDEHCMVYRLDKDYGYLCSRAIEMKTESKYMPLVDVPEPEDFRKYLLNLYESERVPLILARRRVNVLDEMYDAILTLRDHFLATYNILWLPIFKIPYDRH